MTYGDLVARLVALRAQRYPSSAALARDLGVSPQKLRNWETERNRADFEDLECWAEKLGFSLVLSLSRDGAGDGPGDGPGDIALLLELAALSDEQRTLTRQLLRMLPHISARDMTLLRGIIGAFTAASARTEAHPAPRAPAAHAPASQTAFRTPAPRTETPR